MLKSFALESQKIIVTGAGGLLGRQHCIAIANAGGLPLALDIHASSLEYLKREFDKNGLAVKCYTVDITKEDKLTEISRRVVDEFGSINGLVNNAAINPKLKKSEDIEFSRVENFDMQEWDKAIEVGLKGTFICSKIFGQQMVNQSDGGVILNIASDLGLLAPNQGLYKVEGLPENLQPTKPVTYSVVKHGVIGLTRYFSTYWPKKIRVNALCPGGVYDNQPADFLEKIKELIPMGRLANPDEYNGTIVFLLSAASSYMNGAIVSADGGRSAW